METPEVGPRLKAPYAFGTPPDSRGPVGSFSYRDATVRELRSHPSAALRRLETGRASPAPTGVLSVSDSAFKPAHQAAPGWDFVSGLGSGNVANIVNNWSTVAP